MLLLSFPGMVSRFIWFLVLDCEHEEKLYENGQTWTDRCMTWWVTHSLTHNSLWHDQVFQKENNQIMAFCSCLCAIISLHSSYFDCLRIILCGYIFSPSVSIHTAIFFLLSFCYNGGWLCSDADCSKYFHIKDFYWMILCSFINFLIFWIS